EVDESLLRARGQRHPSSAELLAFAFRGPLEEVVPGIGDHVALGCAPCAKRLGKMKGLAGAVRESLAEDMELQESVHGRGQVLDAEAALLEAQVFTWLGRHEEAALTASSARGLFEQAGDSGFGAALCDYFEGSARLLEGDTAEARRLLQDALQAFAGYGQRDW